MERECSTDWSRIIACTMARRIAAWYVCKKQDANGNEVTYSFITGRLHERRAAALGGVGRLLPRVADLRGAPRSHPARSGRGSSTSSSIGSVGSRSRCGRARPRRTTPIGRTTSVRAIRVDGAIAADRGRRHGCQPRRHAARVARPELRLLPTRPGPADVARPRRSAARGIAARWQPHPGSSVGRRPPRHPGDDRHRSLAPGKPGPRPVRLTPTSARTGQRRCSTRREPSSPT